ncbi:hypothetical protein ACHMW7_09610 [Aminobacter sp. UC22_36]|uniref:hypothetical protein n=1 Tax=Aminobacter sp. UC22_36 TaxID=3374549 RepID=UPI003757AD2C
MSFGSPALNSVEVNKKADGYHYKVHFRGSTLDEIGPFSTREEAIAAGNKDLARHEAARR